MNNRDKKNKKNNDSTRTYNIWKQYSDFVRSLYLEKSIKRTTGKEKT